MTKHSSQHSEDRLREVAAQLEQQYDFKIYSVAVQFFNESIQPGMVILEMHNRKTPSPWNILRLVLKQVEALNKNNPSRSMTNLYEGISRFYSRTPEKFTDMLDEAMRLTNQEKK